FIMLAVPAFGSSEWVEEFLRRYEPSKNAPSAVSKSIEGPTQLFRTGEVPIAMNDIINLMIDNNLDISANRLAPPSSYLPSLVFYRALLPSLRLTGNIGRDVVLSTTQLNGATSRIQNTGLFDANLSQLLPTGTSFNVDLSMSRLLTNSNNSIFNPSYT